MRIPAALLIAATVAAPCAPVSSPVTFNKDIAPIIYKNCAMCHRPGECAPFPLLSYENVTKKARTISDAVESHLMPPWKAEPASFPYRDERRLTDAEVATILSWVKAGMPEGDGPKPQPPEFKSGWRLGEPDLVVEMPAFHVPAEGADIYRNIAVPLGISEDKWITAIDMRPSARAVVHHVLYFDDPDGKAHLRPAQGKEPGFSGMRAGNKTLPLGGWALGAQPAFFPHGLALHAPANSDLVVQYHFHPSGKAETEKSLVGFYFAKEPPSRKLVRIQMPPHYSLFSGLDIPAGKKDFVIKDSYTLPYAIDAVGVGAHAHYIAKKLKMTATLPNGDVKTLLLINDWDFAWQDRYYFQDFVALPQGTRLDAEIHWDNSASNARNPSSPPVRVTWGEQTKDEMGSISLMAVAHEKKDYAPMQTAIREHQMKYVGDRMKTNAALAKMVQKLLNE